MSLKTLKDRIGGKILTRFPSLLERWANSGKFVVNLEIPWTELSKAPEECRVALVTTAGVHLRSQMPYDMEDPEGDPTFREIPAGVDPQDLIITHNYYDHRDADRDINVVFPLQRMRELEAEGVIGEIASRHFSFMGHIIGRHLDTLIQRTGPEVAKILKGDGVDAVFLTPA